MKIKQDKVPMFLGTPVPKSTKKNILDTRSGGGRELCTHNPRGGNPRDSHLPRGQRGALARSQRAGQHRLAIPGSCSFISVVCWIDCFIG